MSKIKQINNIKNLFEPKIEEIKNILLKDYYKSIKAINSFDNKKTYLEYKSKGDKDKNLSPKEYLDMVRPYLRDMINDHETSMKLKVHSRDKVFDYER